MPDLAMAQVATDRGLVGGPFGSSLVGNDYVASGIPVIRGANMVGREIGGCYVFVSPEKFANELSRNSAVPGDLIFTQRGTLGQVALVPDGPYSTYVISQSQMRLRVNTTVADPKYVYYAAISRDFVKQVYDNAISTGVPHINLGILARLTIPSRPLPEQRTIAEVLGALDDKIAANSRSVTLLAELSNARYLAALGEGRHIAPLGELVDFGNRRRVPLSSREREARRGSVPYYGAAGPIDFVDEAIFDDQLVLVGEDGSVMDDDGRPVVQYVWGPAWVNNHAHVLTGRGISTELLAVTLRHANVAHLVTGAVQPKLSMGRLQTLNLEIPDHTSVLERLVGDAFALHRALVVENRQLEAVRDELLPLLMSGRIRVRDAEKVVEEVV